MATKYPCVSLREEALRRIDPAVEAHRPTRQTGMDYWKGSEVASLSDTLAPFASAIHAYDVTDALTYGKDGDELPHYQR